MKLSEVFSHLTAAEQELLARQEHGYLEGGGRRELSIAITHLQTSLLWLGEYNSGLAGVETLTISEET